MRLVVDVASSGSTDLPRQVRPTRSVRVGGGADYGDLESATEPGKSERRYELTRLVSLASVGSSPVRVRASGVARSALLTSSANVVLRASSSNVSSVLDGI